MKDNCPHTYKIWGPWSSGCYQSRQQTCVTCQDGTDTETRTEHNMQHVAEKLPGGGTYRYQKCSRCGATG